jgi:hypothetical protein
VDRGEWVVAPRDEDARRAAVRSIAWLGVDANSPESVEHDCYIRGGSLPSKKQMRKKPCSDGRTRNREPPGTLASPPAAHAKAESCNERGNLRHENDRDAEKRIVEGMTKVFIQKYACDDDERGTDHRRRGESRLRSRLCFASTHERVLNA